MFKWFKTAHSIEEVKRIYRQLCKEYHPDLHPGEANETAMKEINAEYEKAFNRYKNIHESADDNTKTYTASNDTAETPEEFKHIINMLIKLEGLEIELVGRWIWLTGNTFSYKDTIKGLGFKWANKKKTWYWHRAEDSSRNRKEMSLDEIKHIYGCESFTATGMPKLATV